MKIEKLLSSCSDVNVPIEILQILTFLHFRFLISIWVFNFRQLVYISSLNTASHIEFYSFDNSHAFCIARPMYYKAKEKNLNYIHKAIISGFSLDCQLESKHFVLVTKQGTFFQSDISPDIRICFMKCLYFDSDFN